MRRVVYLALLTFVITFSLYSQFRVVSSTPTDGAYNVPSTPNVVCVRFKFSAPVDTLRFFIGNPSDNLPRYLGFLAFDPIDSIEIVSSSYSESDTSVCISVKLAPNTDYSIVLMGAYSRQGAMLEKVYVLNFTTAPTRGNRTVSGTITPPSRSVVSFSDISNFINLKVKDRIEELSRVFSSDVKGINVRKSEVNLFDFNFKVQGLGHKISSVDPNAGVALLLDGNPFVDEEVAIKYSANVASDLSFTFNYVRDGSYYLFVLFDTQRDGMYLPRSNDLLMFYDNNGDGQPDQVTVTENVTGLVVSGYLKVQPFTVREKLDTVTSVARSFASDAELRGIQAMEGFEGDTLDGKVFTAAYIFYAPSRDKYFNVYVDAMMGILLDTSNVSIEPKVNLPAMFIDSDVAFDSAEANGGYAFRSEPNTVTSI
ncbi:MAG: hypothetical protein RMJ81_10095, partial [Candidatus Kryptonium sp.]|nr:hypothetical protein [Candidatus Kryptonium sp.]